MQYSVPRIFFLAAFVCLCGAIPTAHAQETNGLDQPLPQNLIVATKAAPPFAFQADDGTWQGLSIDLWRAVAEELDITYELRELELDDMLAAVESGEVDVAVAALTVTAERERDMDFSHPFYSSGLGIALATDISRGGWVTVLRGVFSLAFLQGVLALSAVLIIAGVAVWFFERRQNAEQFGGGAVKGLWSGFWWSAVTMTTVGYGDKAPTTIGGRLIALIWMFTSIIIISGFTAAIASSLTVGGLVTDIRNADDLPGRSVGAVSDSTAAAYLRSSRVAASPYTDAQAGLNALKRGEIEAFIYDAPILQYLISSSPDLQPHTAVLPNTIKRQDYAIALNLDSPLRKPINAALLNHITSDAWRDTLFEYLGE